MALIRMSKKRSIAVFSNRLVVPGEFLPAPVLGHRVVGLHSCHGCHFQPPDAPLNVGRFALRILALSFAVGHAATIRRFGYELTLEITRARLVDSL